MRHTQSLSPTPAFTLKALNKLGQLELLFWQLSRAQVTADKLGGTDKARNRQDMKNNRRCPAKDKTPNGNQNCWS